jgi:beta-glucosidase
MTAYNSINGYHAASNYDLTKTLLRDEWKYDGFVMTDWWAHITNLDGTTSTKDFASMIKSQNDIYMVMENAKTNQDNLMESLENGYLKRAELQFCAKNLCKFAMNTHAYERFKANGFKYDISDLDTSNMNVIASYDNVSLDTPIDLSLEKSGKYIVEIEFTSPLTSLAQIAINLNLDHAGACTFVAKGTDGGVGIMKSHVSIMNWNKKIVLSSKADVTVKSVKFLM